MTTNQKRLGSVIALAFALPASAAFGQMTGVSHPDDVPITTSSDGVRQPIVYVPTPAAPASSSYTVTPTTPPSAAPTFVVVPNPPGLASAQNTWRTSPADATHPAGYDPDAHIAGDEPITADAREHMVTSAGANPQLVATTADIDANVVTRVPGPANALPVGTLVKTRMLQAFSTKTTAEGSEWQAELTEPLMRDGRVLIPAGSVLRGKVTEVHGGRRISGQAGIHLLPLSVVLPDGQTLGMHAQVIDTNLYHSTTVDREGTILHRDHKKEEGGILALTTGSGAAAGAIMGGPAGALIGAGVGAGVSTVLWLKQDRQAELPRETQVTFELTRPILVGSDGTL